MLLSPSLPFLPGPHEPPIVCRGLCVATVHAGPRQPKLAMFNLTCHLLARTREEPGAPGLAHGREKATPIRTRLRQGLRTWVDQCPGCSRAGLSPVSAGADAGPGHRGASVSLCPLPPVLCPKRGFWASASARWAAPGLRGTREAESPADEVAGRGAALTPDTSVIQAAA